LLVPDAEAVLLIDDDEAEVAEADVLLEQAVRADDDVDVAALDSLDGLLLLRGQAEARQHLDFHRERGEPLAERLVVLLRKDRRRNDDGDLLAVHDRLEGSAARELRLPVADGADDEAGDLVDAVGREPPGAVGEREDEVFALHADDLLRLEPLEARDARVLVHDVVAWLQVLEERADGHAPAPALGMARLAEAEDLR